MLSSMIDILVTVIMAITTVFGSITAALTTEYSHVAVVPAAVVTPAPVVPQVTDLPVLPVTDEYNVIERGASGESVLALQQRLAELGYYTGNLTGKMDSTTQLAFKKFERANGFAANGVASAEEQAVLFSEDAVAAQ